MLYSWDEGLKHKNNIPLSIEVLIQKFKGRPFKTYWSNMHYHEYVEILYAVKGDFFIMHNGEIIDLPEGAMFIANSYEPHNTKHTDENGILICIKFMPQVLFSSNQTVTEMEYSVPYVFDNFGDIRVFKNDVLKDSIIPKEFEYLWAEFDEKKFGYELVERSCVIRIFSWIMRFWYESVGSPSLPSNKKAAETVGKIREYVDRHYLDASLSEAAKYCGLSYSYFSRISTKYMNMNFSDYVNLVKVNKSLKLLASTDLSITEIAATLGFSTTSYYIQVFKKFKNLSPGALRKMLK